MRVKIGNIIYSSDIEPIILILEKEERELVSNMGDQAKICFFPELSSVESIENFMRNN